jgi:hypothetical protein
LEFYYDIVKMALPLKVAMSDVELLEILKNNMRPGLRVHLAGRFVHSMAELVSISIATKDVWKMEG